MTALVWQKPMWGAVLQQLAGGGGAPPDVGSTFALMTNISGPNTSSSWRQVPHMIGEGDDKVSFTAPFDMTLKATTSRVASASGLNVTLDLGIRLNGGAVTTLGTVSNIVSASVDFFDTEVAITAGDEVELLYSTGNNSTKGIGLGFYFEATTATDRSSGSFWVPNYRTSVSTSFLSAFVGDFGSYNVIPVAPVSMILRSIHIGFSVATTDDVEFQFLDDQGGATTIGTLLSGGTTLSLTDIDLPILAGVRIPVIQAKAASVAQSGYNAVMEYQIAAFEDKPNQSILGFTDTDARLAEAWHYGRFIAPTNGVIKELYLNTKFSYGAVAVNVGINDVETEVFNGALTADVMETVLPNIGFTAGDRIQFYHDGTGLTGGGLDLMVLIETPYGAAYESPVYVPPVDPVSDGIAAAYPMNNYTASTSSNSIKANMYQFAGDRMLTRIECDSNTIGQVVKFVVWEIDASYNFVASIYESAAEATVDGRPGVDLDPPVLLEDGKIYVIGPIRTDVTQMRMDYDRSPVDFDPNGYGLYLGYWADAANVAPSVGNSYYIASNNAWDIEVTTTGANTEGTFRYWSILMEGSDALTAHALAGIEMRQAPGGANLASADIMFASSADSIADLANLFDADNATVWEITDADFDAADRRLVFAFDTATTIQEIVMQAPTANFNKTPTDFKLQFSEDGFLWNDAYTVTGEAAWATNESRTFTRPQPALPGSGDHRYWAVVCTDTTNGQSYTSMAELQMRETLGGADVATSGNAIFGSERVGGEAANAFDNDGATHWICEIDSSTPQIDRWIGQDFGLGNDTNIAEIAITSRTTNQQQTPTKGALMYSDNGTDWKIAWTWGDISSWTASETRVFSRP